MTKVKTILAEFCSPKDILAINRLGLIKKEERETQPIPWRHRLNNTERRELVRSELRMPFRPQSHHGRNEHTRAINSAKSPKDSKMGECLINSHSKSSSLLGTRLGKLSTEQRRTECRLQQTKKNFIRTSKCLNHEPLILVERPATPKVNSRASFMQKHGIDPAVVEVPRYRRPTLSQSRAPSTLTTIEAFTMNGKKKKNLWEEAVEDRDAIKFKSISKSSARLTDNEIKMLKIGHSLHKPTEESISREKTPDIEDDPEASPPPRCVSGKKRKPRPKTPKTPEVVQRPETVAEESIFITQLSNKEFANKQSNKLKSVTFSDFGNTNIKTKPRNDNSKEFLTSHQQGRAILRQKEKQDSSQIVDETNNNKNTPASSKPGTLKRNDSKKFLNLLLKT